VDIQVELKTKCVFETEEGQD